MVINPIVGVHIPIIRIPIKGGMTIPQKTRLLAMAHVEYFKYFCILTPIQGSWLAPKQWDIYIYKYLYLPAASKPLKCREIFPTCPVLIEFFLWWGGSSLFMGPVWNNKKCHCSRKVFPHNDSNNDNDNHNRHHHHPYWGWTLFFQSHIYCITRSSKFYCDSKVDVLAIAIVWPSHFTLSKESLESKSQNITDRQWIAMSLASSLSCWMMPWLFLLSGFWRVKLSTTWC